MSDLTSSDRDKGAFSFVRGILEDIRAQRKVRMDGKEVVSPVGRVDIRGIKYLGPLINSLMINEEELDIRSLEQLGGYYCVVFKDGTRCYDIDLDKLPG